MIKKSKLKIKSKALSLKLPNFGIKIKGQVWGEDASKLPILALHGWLDNSNSFELLASSLVGEKIIALDLPGHGLSAPIARGHPYQIMLTALQCLEALHTLEIKKVKLLGHSLGGCLALLMASLENQKIHSVISLDSMGPITISPQKEFELANEYVHKFFFAPSKQQRLYKSFREAVLIRQKISSLSQAAAIAICKRALKKTKDKQFSWKHDPRLRWPLFHPLSEEAWLAYLGKINCPVSFVLPQETWIQDKKQLTKRLTKLKNYTQLTTQGGHYPHWDSLNKIKTLFS